MKGRIVWERPGVWLDYATGAVASGLPSTTVKRVTPRPRVRDLCEAWEALGRPSVVWLVGTVPTTRAWLRQWASEPLPEGWEEGGHWWPDTGAPVLRFQMLGNNPTYWDRSTVRDERPNMRDKFTVEMGSSWFGDTTGITAGQALSATNRLRVVLRERFGGTPVCGTPVRTGLESMLRALPASVDPTPWPADLQALVRSSVGQHRMELCGGGWTVREGFWEHDMSLAYGALTWGLGAGEPVWFDRWHPEAFALWEVTATVPDDWGDRWGILPLKRRGGIGWRWPREGTFDTWAEGSEVQWAINHGWRVEVRRGVGSVNPKADPLGTWGRNLRKEALRAKNGGDPLVYKALRAVLLQGIGGMVARPQRTYRTGYPADTPRDKVLPGTLRQVGDGRVTWQEMSTPNRGVLAHPEWASRIWGRCRARAWLAADETDAFGIRGDAIYTERPQPPAQVGVWHSTWYGHGYGCMLSLADVDSYKGLHYQGGTVEEEAVLS